MKTWQRALVALDRPRSLLELACAMSTSKMVAATAVQLLVRHGAAVCWVCLSYQRLPGQRSHSMPSSHRSTAWADCVGTMGCMPGRRSSSGSPSTVK